ncbi:MAG TPA: TolC family protein [Vicinamibacterales bacterium]|nr:TolC family protein [Vicinamibacterales bacterium]
MKRRSVAVCACAAVLLFTARTALAQAALPGVVTIDQAVDEALTHNLSLLAQRASLPVADAAVITARLRPNPVASFSADHLDLLGTGFNDVNNGGPPEIAMRVDLPIERGGKRELRAGVATTAKDVAEADLADTVRSLRLDVTLACIDLLQAKGTRDLVVDTLHSFEDLARVNDSRVAAGAIAPFEATRSRIAMLQFRSTVTKAELDVAAATARLRLLLGRPVSAPLDIAGDLDVPGESRSLDADTLTRAAVETRPDLHSLQLQQARSTADLRLQEANGKIDYSVGTEYRRQQGIAGKSNSLGFFVSAPLPIFSKNQGEIARAGFEMGQETRQIEASRALIESDVASSLHEYSVTKELVGSIERDLLAPARSARDISSYTYKSGGTTLLEFLDAQRAFNDTMQSYVDARAGLRRAASRLNAAVGAEVVK